MRLKESILELKILGIDFLLILGYFVNKTHQLVKGVTKLGRA